MAKKQPPKPLFAVKHDFVEALDAHCQQSIMFLQQVEHVLELDQIKNPEVAKLLRERATAFRATLLTEG